jgi:hypothetical protein
MHPRAEFPEPATEREFGQGCECLAKALREHKAPRRQLSVRTMNEQEQLGSCEGHTYRSKVEVIKDAATRFPNGGATVLLLTLLSIGVGQRVNVQGGRAYHKIHRPALSVYSRGSHEAEKSYRDSLMKAHQGGRTDAWVHVPCLEREEEGYRL